MRPIGWWFRLLLSLFRLSAFVLRTLFHAKEGDWEKEYFFIPTELLNQVASWLCTRQESSGAFREDAPIYDRKQRVNNWKYRCTCAKKRNPIWQTDWTPPPFERGGGGGWEGGFEGGGIYLCYLYYNIFIETLARRMFLCATPPFKNNIFSKPLFSSEE